MKKIRYYLIILALMFCKIYIYAEESIINDTFAIYLNKSKESRSRNNFEESITYLFQGLKYCKSDKDIATIYNSLGRNYFSISDYHTAIRFYDSAFIYTDIKDNPLFTGYLYNNLGLAYTQLMDFNSAIKHYQKAINLLDNESIGILYYNISKCYGYLELKDSTINYLNKSYSHNILYLGEKSYYTILTELEIAEYKGIISNNLKNRTLMGSNDFLKGKYYTIIGDISQAEKYLHNKSKSLLELYVKYNLWAKAVDLIDTLRTSYLSVDSKLFLQANERLIYKNAIDLKLKSDTLQAFNIALKSYANVLKEKINYNIEEHPRSYNYFDFDSLIYLFIVEENIRFYKIETGNTFQKNYNQFLSAFNLRHILDSFMINFKQYAESSFYLYNKLLPEVKEQMLIIPEGRLLYLPFEALLTEFPDTSNYPIYKELPYLLNIADIRYDYILREYRKPIGRKKIIALAPNNSLKYSYKEVRHLNKYNSKCLTGKRAILSSIYKGNILHIATHYDPRDYNIKFADSTLNLDKIKYMHKDMVVLSTCYSGFGKRYEAEGSFSAGRAFYIAGTEGIIESVWLNDDRSSFLIFSSFYENLVKGKSKGTSLTEAKREHLESCPSSLSHPYFWSNIRFFGNNHPININRSLNYKYVIIMSLLSIVLIYYFFRFQRK